MLLVCICDHKYNTNVILRITPSEENVGNAEGKKASLGKAHCLLHSYKGTAARD